MVKRGCALTLSGIALIGCNAVLGIGEPVRPREDPSSGGQGGEDPSSGGQGGGTPIPIPPMIDEAPVMPPSPPADPCLSVTCDTGQVCESENGQTRCITVDLCSAVACDEPLVCQAYDGAAHCVNTDPCAGLVCAYGTYCQAVGEREARCTGWCEGVFCGAGYHCDSGDGFCHQDERVCSVGGRYHQIVSVAEINCYHASWVTDPPYSLETRQESARQNILLSGQLIEQDVDLTVSATYEFVAASPGNWSTDNCSYGSDTIGPVYYFTGGFFYDYDPGPENYDSYCKVVLHRSLLDLD